MGPDDLPDMKKLLPPNNQVTLIKLTEKDIHKEFGTVPYAIYIGVLSDWLKSKNFFGRLLYFMKRIFN